MNKVFLMGRVGQLPEIKTTEGGKKLARFSLATSSSYKDSAGEWQNQTEWHNISAWGYAADKVERTAKKGSLLVVEGKITYRKYTDKNGVERTATEIVAETVNFTEKAETSDLGEPVKVAMPNPKASASDTDDLPF